MDKIKDVTILDNEKFVATIEDVKYCIDRGFASLAKAYAIKLVRRYAYYVL